MSSRSHMVLALVGLVFLLSVGLVFVALCAASPYQRESKRKRSEGSEQIVLRVEDMTRRLELFWLDWPNRVAEALSGLPGVEVIDVDLDRDELTLGYDPKKLTPETMVEVVRKQGFKGTIVRGDRWAVFPPLSRGERGEELPLASSRGTSMRSFFRFLLLVFTLGLGMIGCSKKASQEAPQRDVVLSVPGMTWPTGWEARVRKALDTLPWVEQDSLYFDFDQREVRFNLKDKKAFNEDQVREALKAQKFREVTVKSVAH